jgi:hypothetical protein
LGQVVAALFLAGRRVRAAHDDPGDGDPEDDDAGVRRQE